jgi:hypothetical protein
MCYRLVHLSHLSICLFSRGEIGYRRITLHWTTIHLPTLKLAIACCHGCRLLVNQSSFRVEPQPRDSWPMS